MSSGNPISTQPTRSGALIGTTTTWCGCPPSSAISLAWPSCRACGASASASGASSAATPPLAPCSANSVLSSAVSVAPIRAPWFSSAEAMVRSSLDRTAARNP